MIKLQIIGHLGKDAVVKEINGKNVINFSVAHSERFKDAQGNQKERTTWVECAYWTDKTAVAQYLTSGTQVYVEGQPEADAYLDRENNAKATLRLRVSNVQLLGSANGNKQDQQTQQQAAPMQGATHNTQTSGSVINDDLPF